MVNTFLKQATAELDIIFAEFGISFISCEITPKFAIWPKHASSTRLESSPSVTHASRVTCDLKSDRACDSGGAKRRKSVGREGSRF